MNYLEVPSVDDSFIKVKHSKCTNAETDHSLLISHGMAEHSRRYDLFINFLNDHGIDTYIYDHRGHGYRIDDDHPMGMFHHEDGWLKVTTDLKNVAEYIYRNSNKKLSILGHSMGSFITLDVIKDINIFNKIILSGSSVPNTSILFLQKIILIFETLRLKKSGYSVLLDNLIFGGFNKPISQPRTPNDWLSNDTDRVDDYYNDPLCGFVVTNSLWSDMLNGLKKIFSDDHLKKLNKDLQIFILSGDEDPVGDYGRGPKKLANLLNRHNIKPELKLFKGMRHEPLNELNCIKVYEEILNYLLN